MIGNTQDNLRAAAQLAIGLVDEIEYVDLYDQDQAEELQQHVREDGDFCAQATAFVRHPARRDRLKRVIEQIARRLSRNVVAQRMLDPEPLNAACELVSSAVKGLLMAENPQGSAGSAFRRRRLVVKFASIASPWIQDPRAGAGLVSSN